MLVVFGKTVIQLSLLVHEALIIAETLEKSVFLMWISKRLTGVRDK